jgi:hypothetical protein
MVIDFLGPLIGVAVAATLVPDPWFEPLPDIFFDASGANGFGLNKTKDRRTFAAINLVMVRGECLLAA